MSKIYCKEKIDKSSKKRFLVSYFNHNTPATYEDQACTIEQCGEGRNRSLLDLKMLVDGVFKRETPIEDIIYILIDLQLNAKIKALYCNDIHRVVFFNKDKGYYFFGGGAWSFAGAAPYKNRVGVDGYSYEQMLSIYENKNKIK